MASERFACRVLGQHRSTQRKVPRGRADEDALTADIIALASQYGRYGYRRITALLREAGWAVNVKRVERRAIVRHWFEDNGERRREGAQGSAEATEKEPALAQRRVLRPVARVCATGPNDHWRRPERPNHVCTSRLRRGPDRRHRRSDRWRDDGNGRKFRMLIPAWWSPTTAPN
jgi:hypothetical protein